MLPGNRGKSGQVTVAPIKAWRGSPAEDPRPLTAAEVNTPLHLYAMVFLRSPSMRRFRNSSLRMKIGITRMILREFHLTKRSLQHGVPLIS